MPRSLLRWPWQFTRAFGGTVVTLSLFVEDEALCSLDLEDLLRDAGDDRIHGRLRRRGMAAD